MSLYTHEELLAHFGGRRGARGRNVICPAHEDRSPSLTIDFREDKWLLHCKAGCLFEDVVTAAGLDAERLFEETPTQVFEPGEVVAAYEYFNLDGELTFRVCRVMGYDGKKKFFQQEPDGVGGWVNGRNCPPTLYRYPLILRSESVVWVVEGEKDVEALVAAGAEATCNPGGAGRWEESYSRALKGRSIVVVADRDEPGRRHADQVSKSLKRVGCGVRVVEAKFGKDAADHLAAGGALTDFIEGTVDGFPLEVLPDDWKRNYCIAVSNNLASAPGVTYAAMCMALGTAKGNNVKLKLSNTHTVKPIGWWVVVGGSGSTKTPIMKVVVVDGLDGIKRNLDSQYAFAVSNYEKLDKATKAQSKKPRPSRIIATKFTLEGLRGVLGVSPVGVGVYVDEILGWLNGMNEFKPGGKGSERQDWLQIRNGHEWTYDKAEDFATIKEVFVSMIGGVQTKRMKDLVVGGEDGLPARMWWVKQPDLEVDMFAPDVPGELLMQWKEFLLEQRNDIGRTLTLAPEVDVAYRNYIQERLRDMKDMPDHLVPFWKKLRGSFTELLIIVSSFWEEKEISLASVERTQLLTDWLLDQIREMFIGFEETEQYQRLNVGHERKVYDFLTAHAGVATQRQIDHGPLRMVDPQERRKLMQSLVEAGVVTRLKLLLPGAKYKSPGYSLVEMLEAEGGVVKSVDMSGHKGTF